MRFSIVVGTAAELIKMYPVIRAVEQRGLQHQIVATGQSPISLARQMADFELSTEIHRPVHSERDLGGTVQAMRWFARAWKSQVKLTEMVLVHGDTLSTVVGTHWAQREGRPVVHVEAGLRSKRRFSPFPEEICRRWVSRRAVWHMAPNAEATENLRNKKVINTGANTLADAVKLFASTEVAPRGFGLVNIHRYENLRSSARWEKILATVTRAASLCPLTWVLHPSTKARLGSEERKRLEDVGVTFTDRLPFSVFIKQLSEAEFLLSDGGSNQEECSYLGVPCLILRNETERSEGLGENILLAPFASNDADDFLAEPRRFRRPPRWPRESPSGIIADFLLNVGRNP